MISLISKNRFIYTLILRNYNYGIMSEKEKLPSALFSPIRTYALPRIFYNWQFGQA